MTELLDLNYELPQNIISQVQGNSALKIYNKVPEALRVNIKYNEVNGIIDSTNLLAVGIDEVVKPFGFRTLNLRDLSLPEVMNFANYLYQIDARNLVITSSRGGDESKNLLLEQICNIVEEKEGRVKFPFMIEGFSYVPSEQGYTKHYIANCDFAEAADIIASGNFTYGIDIVANDDFRIIQDKRFLPKHDKKTFSEVDERGLPKFDKKGDRTWNVDPGSLSRVFLDDGLGLSCNFMPLDYKFIIGRVLIKNDANIQVRPSDVKLVPKQLPRFTRNQEAS